MRLGHLNLIQRVGFLMPLSSFLSISILHCLNIFGVAIGEIQHTVEETKKLGDFTLPKLAERVSVLGKYTGVAGVVGGEGVPILIDEIKIANRAVEMGGRGYIYIIFETKMFLDLNGELANGESEGALDIDHTILK